MVLDIKCHFKKVIWPQSLLHLLYSKHFHNFYNSVSIKQIHGVHSTYIIFFCGDFALEGQQGWRCGMLPWESWYDKINRPVGCTECTYPTLLKVTVNVSCTLTKFVSVKTSVFLGIKNPKPLGLSKQPEQGISASWFAFCLCCRSFCTSSCTQILE